MGVAGVGDDDSGYLEGFAKVARMGLATDVVLGIVHRVVHGLCASRDRDRGLGGTPPGALATGNGAGPEMRVGSLLPQPRNRLDRLQPQLYGARRGNCVPRSFAQQLQEWVDEHPEGTPIAVHYDPANRKKAVLVTTDMPLGRPRTPDNLKLLGFFAVSCAVLLTVARVARPR
jgi:hypothetical protein